MIKQYFTHRHKNNSNDQKNSSKEAFNSSNRKKVVQNFKCSYELFFGSFEHFLAHLNIFLLIWNMFYVLWAIFWLIWSIFFCSFKLFFCSIELFLLIWTILLAHINYIYASDTNCEQSGRKSYGFQLSQYSITILKDDANQFPCLLGHPVILNYHIRWESTSPHKNFD